MLVEGDTVDGPDITVMGVLIFLTVAFKTKIIFVDLRRVVQVNVDNSTASLNATDCITLTISKGTDSTSSVLKWALCNVNWVTTTTCDSLQIPNMYKFLRM